MFFRISSFFVVAFCATAMSSMSESASAHTHACATTVAPSYYLQKTRATSGVLTYTHRSSSLYHHYTPQSSSTEWLAGWLVWSTDVVVVTHHCRPIARIHTSCEREYYSYALFGWVVLLLTSAAAVHLFKRNNEKDYRVIDVYDRRCHHYPVTHNGSSIH